MYLEKRRLGKKTKYYLAYSYREGKVRKIRRYLGQNLSKKELDAAKKNARLEIGPLLEEHSTEVFLFTLTKKQIERLNNFDFSIKHFDSKDWQVFTEEFVFNTNAIEGSDIERGEVPAILHKRRIKGDDELETQGVAKAVAYIRETNEELSVELLKHLHHLCFAGSKPFAGEFRIVDVVIRNGKGAVVHRGVTCAKLHFALKDMISWYNIHKKKFKSLVLAAIMHNQFEYIHPFQDGNGRVGRLLMNFILIRNGYPPINISLEDRDEYYRTLQEYQHRQNLKPTMEFLVRQYKKTLRQVSQRSNNP